MMIWIGIPVAWMIWDKKPPNLIDKVLPNLTIIILACPSVTKKALFFYFFWIIYLDRGNIKKESFLGCVLM